MLERNSILAALAKGKAMAQSHEFYYVQVHSHANGDLRLNISSEGQIEDTIREAGELATADLVIEHRARNVLDKGTQKRFAI